MAAAPPTPVDQGAMRNAAESQAPFGRTLPYGGAAMGKPPAQSPNQRARRLEPN